MNDVVNKMYRTLKNIYSFGKVSRAVELTVKVHLMIYMKVVDYFLLLCFNTPMTLRILIDTNIIIGLEDNKVIDERFSDFIRYAQSNQCPIFLHPECQRDISRDRNPERREITLSKAKKYLPLPNPAELTEEFNEWVGKKNENDEIDNKQLFQLYCGYVELFVTEDKGILKKAEKLGLQDKVLSITDALNKLRKKFEYRVPQHPILKPCSVRAIKDRITEPFFESLKADYEGFGHWFDKCVRQDRQCYSLTVDGKLSALLIYNREKAEQHRIPGIFEDALKMCTFKTNEDAFGLKMGELFLNKMFQLCVERSINYLYLTLFEKYKFLVGLLTKFGFSKKEIINKDNNHEIVMIKDLKKSETTKKSNSIRIHPFYSDSQEFNKFVIPIRQPYYDSLFKDSSLRARTLFDQDRISLNEIQGNSIIKAYICGAKRKNLRQGDILFFYSSRKLRLIQPIGILKKAHFIKDLDKLKSTVRGKTVFSESKLEKIYNESSGSLMVIIFRLIYYLERPIEFETIKGLKCFSNKFMTITKMPESDYLYLKKEDFFDERYIID